MGVPRIKPKTLQAGYGKIRGHVEDLCFSWGEECDKSDARLLDRVFGDLLPELQRRGYDIHTLKFSVRKP